MAASRSFRQTLIRRSHARYSALTASATISGVSVAVGARPGAAATGPERTVGPAGLGVLENILLYHGRDSVVVVGGGSAATAGAVAPAASAAASPQARN